MTDDPFAITERPIPLSPLVSDVDLRASVIEQIERYGRLENEKEQDDKAATAALRRFVLDLLPVLDALERVRNAAAPGSDNGTGAGNGVAGVQKKMLRTLARHGVEQVSLTGRPADPKLVDIDGERFVPSEEDGTVVEEIVVAYRWRGEVVRRGLVVTSTPHHVPSTDRDGGD